MWIFWIFRNVRAYRAIGFVWQMYMFAARTHMWQNQGKWRPERKIARKNGSNKEIFQNDELR